MRAWLRRLRLVGRSRRFDSELDAELRFHIDMRARTLEADGLSPDAAQRQAHLELGNRLRVREEARDVWRGGGIERLVQDLRFGWRTLRRNPTFSLTVVLTLALGIGANTAIFSVVDAVLLRPLPYAAPDRLVLLWATSPASPLDTLTPGTFYDFRGHLTTLTGLAGISHLPVTLTGTGAAERHAAMSVSTDFFQILGVSAEIGRTFGASDAPGSRVVVVSQRLWRATFHSDPSWVGRRVTLNGKPYDVVGVMAASFVLPSITPQPANDDGPELWIPGDVHEIPGVPLASDADRRTDRRTGYVRAIGRLRPSVDLDAAQAEVSALAAKLSREYPRENAQVGARLVPFAGYLVQQARQPLTVLFLAVGAVLAIACANIASLLLARATARQQEIALRLALGASRRRVIRQLLTESVLLGLIAGACGILAGDAMLHGLVSLGAANLLRLHEASIDGPAMAFALGLAALAALLFGTLPAVQGSRPQLGGALNDRSGPSSDSLSKQRLRRALVASEIAFACVLLTCAALLGRSLWTLLRVDPGYDARHLLAAEVFLAGPLAEDPSRQVDFYERFLTRVRRLPGVDSAAAVVNLPVGGDDFGAPVVAEGGPPLTPGTQARVNYQVASTDYFRTMRIPVVSGREFAPGDTRDAPLVAVVNDAFVRRHWPDGSAIGRRVRLSATAPWLTIVGVVGNVRHGGLSAPVRMELYQPYTQQPFPFMSFVIRTAGDPLASASLVRQALAGVDASVPLSGVSTLEDRLQVSVANTRFLSILLLLFAVVAVLVAATGVYGVVALGVAQRLREIAIRVALGATRRQVMGLVLGQGLVTLIGGLAIGLGLSFAAGRALEGLLFGVSAHDRLAFLGVPLALAAVALIATYVPARRAARLAPSAALRMP
jgi:predicted permease